MVCHEMAIFNFTAKQCILLKTSIKRLPRVIISIRIQDSSIKYHNMLIYNETYTRTKETDTIIGNLNDILSSHNFLSYIAYLDQSGNYSSDFKNATNDTKKFPINTSSAV